MKTKFVFVFFFLVGKVSHSCSPKSLCTCMCSHYCVFIVCLELRGADRQFPAHTTIEQQNFLSVCAISFSEHVVSLYIEQILHRYIPRTSGKPCLHFKVWLQTMEVPQFLAKKSSVKNFRRIFPKNLPQLEILGLKRLDVRGANVVQKKMYPEESSLTFMYLIRQGRRLWDQDAGEFLILINVSG